MSFKKSFVFEVDFPQQKKHFLAEFIVLFVSLIYFLQNNDKILVPYKLGWHFSATVYVKSSHAYRSLKKNIRQGNGNFTNSI